MVGTLMRYSFVMRDDRTTSLSEPMKPGAFANPKLLKPRKPMEESELLKSFSRLLRKPPVQNPPMEEKKEENQENEAPKDNGQTSDENKNDETKEKAEDQSSTTTSTASAMSFTSNDYILVDLRTPPFVSSQALAKNELGNFYKECSKAPPLQEFDEMPTLQELDIPKQLEDFEANISEYDAMVQSLCQSSPNNN